MKLDSFFKPSSIAVIGASRDKNKVGHKILSNLLNFGYEGEVYPVNPYAEKILGIKCYKNVIDIHNKIDLAVIAVPAHLVPIIAEECGHKNVKGIIVISSGFGEIGRSGTRLEKTLLSICRKHKIRMQGPNCLGIINTMNRMNASFAGASPSLGKISFVSQSGALGSTIINWTIQKRVGFSSFISLGNESDLTAADFLEYLGEDDHTRAVGLYLEGVKDGSKFIKVVQKISKMKPIIALKAGTTDIGMRAVSSHTGSLAGSNIAFSAAFKKAGILSVETLEELFNLVLAFEAQPLPRGGRVLVVTNGGGPGILVADACERYGLTLPLLENNLREKLRHQLPSHASISNPIDVLGDADESRYRLAVDVGLQSSNIDGIIVILTPQAMTPANKIAKSLIETQILRTKPIVTAFMGLADDSAPIRTLQNAEIPNYSFPEFTAYVLKKLLDYKLIKQSITEEIPTFKVFDDNSIARTIMRVKREGRLNLTINESFDVGHALGVKVPKTAIVRSSGEVGSLAEKIGFPLAMKIVSTEILHKTDFGGVILNIETREEAEKSYDLIMTNVANSIPQARVSGVMLQEMVPTGKEVIIGAVRDYQFGILVMFGLGGIYVNFLRDVSYRLGPLTKEEARSMIEETKAYDLLKGVRGEIPSNINSVIDVLLRISDCMNRFSNIVEMEINPLFVYEVGKPSIAVDMRISITK